MHLVTFPSLGPAPIETWSAAARVLAAVPSAGEPVAALRQRLLEVKHVDAAAVPRWLAMFGVAHREGMATPDTACQPLLAGPTAEALATRLWQVNPLLASAIFGLLGERPYGRDELYKYLGSAAYPGHPISRPEFEAWLAWASLAGVIRPLGVAIALGAAAVWEHLAGAFDAEAYLASEGAMPPGDARDSAVVRMSMDVPSAVTTAAVHQVAQLVPAAYPGATPHSAWAIPPAVMGQPTAAPMEPAARDLARHAAINETDAAVAVAGLVAARAPHVDRLSMADLELTGDHWQEDPQRVMLQLGLVAALAFRVAPAGHFRDKAAVLALYRAILDAQLLDALVEGHLPSAVPQSVDASSLMLASVLARRLAEAPALPDQLARVSTLHALMTALDGALGRGLLSLELFWMARALAELGVVRYPGAATGPAIPWRPVRNALVRWGVLPSPYATSIEELTLASLAADKFAVGAMAGDVVVLAFDALGGCGSWAASQAGLPAADGCNKRDCLPFCRERTDIA